MLSLSFLMFVGRSRHRHLAMNSFTGCTGFKCKMDDRGQLSKEISVLGVFIANSHEGKDLDEYSFCCTYHRSRTQRATKNMEDKTRLLAIFTYWAPLQRPI